MYKVRWSMRDLTYNAVSTEFGKLPNPSGNVRDHCENTVLEALVGDWGNPLLTPRSPTKVQGWDATSTP